MDSNRKFINFKDIFKDRDVKIIQCGSANAANNIIKKMKITDEILLHIGVNDLESKEPNVAVQDISKIAQLLKDKCSKLYVSEITPRNDNLGSKVKMANALLLTEMQSNHIQVIQHRNIKDVHLHDKKHLSKIWSTQNLSGVEELSVDFANSINGQRNNVNLVKSFRKTNSYHERPQYSNNRYQRRYNTDRAKRNYNTHLNPESEKAINSKDRRQNGQHQQNRMNFTNEETYNNFNRFVKFITSCNNFF